MQALKARIIEILSASPHAKSPEAEAEQILFHVFRMSNQSIQKPSDLSTQDPIPNAAQTLEALHVAEDRSKGVPLQHLLGYQFFYSHEYRVDASTLIPRPETEILVDEALRYLKKREIPGGFRFAELGLGSGIISCEILSHFPSCSGVASELNVDAISLAKMNLEQHLGPDFESRFQILHSPSPATGFELLSPHGPFDLVLSNPPYLSFQDEIEKEVRLHEPKNALFPIDESGPLDPMFFYLNLRENCQILLKPSGAVFLEVPHERAGSIEHFFSSNGIYETRLIPDLTGRSRVLFASLISK
ncbi:MAG: peptide chain release factor N(5)-glutamine methyltransferase [Bdellovibrionales bacterium]|nr:peptide chain release factor N(5)-glutamine methyltransferase [Bdellovibrionales bacterium]